MKFALVFAIVLFFALLAVGCLQFGQQTPSQTPNASALPSVPSSASPTPPLATQPARSQGGDAPPLPPA